MVGDRRQGYAIVAVMAMLWVGSVTAVWASRRTPPGRGAAAAGGAGGQGGPVRRSRRSALFAASTTIDLDRRGELDARLLHRARRWRGPLLNMMLGEVAPGGVGTGLYGILVPAVITVFVAGLMVGRTPEYLGKKIGAREMQVGPLYILTPPAAVLHRDRRGAARGSGRDARHHGPHGLSEVLYAYHLGEQQQRQRVRRSQREHRLYNTTLAWPCCSAGSCRSSSSSPWPAPWPGRGRCP